MDGLRIDTLIFGGGIAGLWLLDELRRAGQSALLVEGTALGDGQTISSQGILHSGLKYSLNGLLSSAAREAREMPVRWKQSLSGAVPPDLSGTVVRSESFYLWGTDSALSRMGLFGARLGLQVTPERVAPHECPRILRGIAGPVLRVNEQVISPESLLACLARLNESSILHVDPATGVEFDVPSSGNVRRVKLTSPNGRLQAVLAPRWVVLTAGSGNGALREALQLNPGKMQRRPLQMVLVRGNLPEFYGHCVDGARTRVSITSALDSAGTMVWQVGGQVAEDGVTLDRDALLRHTQAEMCAVIPGMVFDRTEWSTYRVDRAEGATATGGRPDSFKLLTEGNVLTAWPTKLVLAPQLAKAIVSIVAAGQAAAADDMSAIQSWPRPGVALPPWERARTWSPYVEWRRDAA